MPGTNYVTAEAKIFLMQEEPTMKDCTNNGCQCTPTEIKCTDCQSFELK